MADRKKGRFGKNAGVAKSRKKVGETKTGELEAMLRRPEGATITQIVSALSWQAHTIRAVISAGLRKSKGLTVTFTKEASGERVYRIAG
jgi:hypothetical protein